MIKIGITRTTKCLKTVASECKIIKKRQKVENFCPRNLLHFLKKKVRSYGEIVNFLKNLSDEEKYIGCLPPKWKKLFNGKDITKKTKAIQKIFSDFSRAEYSPHSFNPQINQAGMDKFSKKIEKILGKKCNISFVDAGLSGKVFRIKCAGEDIALKIFYSNTPTYLLNLTGKTKEIANAVALNYTLKSSQRAHFYFGKVAIANEPDGFMVSEFVEKKGKSKIENLFNRLYKRFRFRDASTKGNIVNGKIVDFGFIEYNFENFEQQQMAKNLCALIEKHDMEGIETLKKHYQNNIYFQDLLNKYM